ncbi:MAG: DUF3120 domain-containing protein [Leptolyngbyaceae cyanobacterium CRU_2_3]|nr:DUF3120 domain-containing protein [Leptolyngbyaceae cyanobacterium CRU_2_3]
MSSFTFFPENLDSKSLDSRLGQASVEEGGDGVRRFRLVFAASAFLVSVPVFFQAPLVRALPWLSLALTLAWLWLSLALRDRPVTALWGDLLLGFTWTWLAGSIYWGWLRWEPLLHLPIEAMGLPFAWLCLMLGKDKVGNWFYLGSLFGTAITDVYFYLVNLIPQWRQLMVAEPDLVQPIFQSALMQIQTPWGIGCALVLGLILLTVGVVPLRSRQFHWWGFSGAVFSTILVDGIFWFAATSI